ncbi:MAG: amino acid aminotransferase [Hyphomonas oceanitis]|uniref:amino acid aminotransferase n=1 Tax=Hyphomonas oceanitis TaxID=81033 RepID=UPI003001F6E7
MNPAFESLTALAPDALLGLMTAYREDKRAEKFDLGVGVYKDDAGHTPVMSAVAKAEAMILQQQTTKVYEGPRGNPDFCAAIERFVFGDSSHLIEKGRLVSLATPGGCGALYLGVGLMKRLGVKTVWVSRPTWPNHPALIKNTGLAVADYDYADPETGKVDFEGLMASLSQTKRGDGIIIQGPCHNPTGIDLSVKQWIDLAMLTVERGVIPMLDIAYHGFASGLDADMEGARLFLQIAEDSMVSYSCSKNFGLYRERAGCFLGQAYTARAAQAVMTHVADISRTSYSMPPAHGPAIVATILGNPELRAEWEAELTEMRERMIGLRESLSDELVARTGSNRFAALASQNGMFSQVPVTPEATVEMRERHGLYLPSSGRMNIAGLRQADIPRIAEILAEYL